MKKIISSLLIVIFTISMYPKVEAAEIAIKCSSSVFEYADGEYVELKDMDLISIQNNSEIKLQFKITASEEIEDAVISIIKLSDFEITKSIKINGKEQEINKDQFILTIGTTPTVIEIEGNYNKDTGEFMSSLNVEVNDNGSQKTHSFGFKYYVTGEVDTKQYEIAFYGAAGELISSEEISQSTKISAPQYEIVGYNTIGFNEKKDGSGQYFVESTTTKNTNYYAILKPKTFKVDYYVEDELYATKKVEYNQSAYWIDPPIIEGKEFIEWIGILDNVNQNIQVYAVYRNIETKEVEIDFEVIKKMEVDVEIIESEISYEAIKSQIKQKGLNISDDYFVTMQENGTIQYLGNEKIYQDFSENTNETWKLLLGISIAIEVIIVMFLVYKKINRKKSNESI